MSEVGACIGTIFCFCISDVSHVSPVFLLFREKIEADIVLYCFTHAPEVAWQSTRPGIENMDHRQVRTLAESFPPRMMNLHLGLRQWNMFSNRPVFSG